MKPLIATAALLIALAIPATSHADYWQLNVKYFSCGRWMIAEYKFKNIRSLLRAQKSFRSIPKYRNTWIKYVKERK